MSYLRNSSKTHIKRIVKKTRLDCFGVHVYKILDAVLYVPIVGLYNRVQYKNSQLIELKLATADCM